MQHVGIVGGGAWGTALACAAIRANRSVTLWAYESEVVDAINTTHTNPLFLPGIALPETLRATNSLADIAEAECLLLVPPAQHLRRLTQQLAPLLSPATIPVICAKGVENGSLQLMSEVLAETLPNRIFAVLSGPTFAAEVARGQPTAITLACANHAIGSQLVATLGSPAFRPYLTDDVIGAEIGGAVKNVIAIACGIAHGMGLGDNARAALITRGLAEIARLGVALGARRDTLMGLSGLGDLTLTCSSIQSRNFSLGAALGSGKALRDILGERLAVTEGVTTAAALVELADRHGIEMPISNAIDQILNHHADAALTFKSLLARPFRPE